LRRFHLRCGLRFSRPSDRPLDDLNLVARVLCDMLALPLKRVAAIFAPLRFDAAFAYYREAVALARRSGSLSRCFAEVVVSARRAARMRNSAAL